jgi:hypothetical protein
MSLFFADLVRETSRATGVGDFALEGALPGHRRFADTVPSGALFHYAIAGITNASQWETGQGQIGAGGSLSRTPLASSVGGALVDFSPGLKTVALTVAAAWFAAQEESGAVSIGNVEGLQAALDARAALAGAAFAGPVSAPGISSGGDADVSGAYRVDGLKVVGNRATGWGMPTGPASRAAFDSAATSTGQLAQRLRALIEDLIGHGLIGGS